MITDPVEMANQILDLLVANGKMVSFAIFDAVGAVHTRAHDWIRSILEALYQDGKVDRYGQKKKIWQTKVYTWDRNDPYDSVVRSIRVLPAKYVVSTTTETPSPTPPVLTKDQLDRITDEAIMAVRKEFLKKNMVQTEIVVKVNNQVTSTIKGNIHPKMERILRLAANRRNILLVGPAGCGKTHLSEQVAHALNLPFSHISCSAGMSESQLTGRLVPMGDNGQFGYLETEFVRRYEQGGVFLFDEIDAADSNVLLVINSALANGHMAIPNRSEKPIAKKHPDFVCIAAANTHGTGSDRQYVGRNQLDESTLDRFRIGQIEMDYDMDLEAVLCPDDSLRGTLQEYRRRIVNSRIRRIVSTRFLKDAYIMLQAGDSLKEIEDALFSGWSKEEIAKIRQN